MIEFNILKRSSSSQARLGLLKTPHGEIATPAYVPVATQAVVKTLTSDEAISAGCQILISNTFHLHIKPGDKIVAENGGIHNFMNWPHPLMTDSGGFQVFSLGFGLDHGVGKILKSKVDATVQLGEQPQKIKITEHGVHFRSPVDGSPHYLDPATSIKIQENIGADIIFAFDEATSPVADQKYTVQSLIKTHRWAKESLAARTSNQAIYGIVQGGKFPELRRASAQFINSLPFDGFGIGGEYGDDKQTMYNMLDLVVSKLDENRPRHLLGIGHPEDLLPIIKSGIDTFDCIAPTHYARRGTAFTSAGKIDFNKSSLLHDNSPLDPACSCYVCQQYKRSYLAHLIRAREITGLKLLTFHNLHFFNTEVAKIRQQIKAGKI